MACFSVSTLQLEHDLEFLRFQWISTIRTRGSQYEFGAFEIILQCMLIRGIANFLYMSSSATGSSTFVPTASTIKKATIRSHIKDVLKPLSKDDIERNSVAILARIQKMPEFQSSGSICVYLSMPAGEVHTYELIQHAFNAQKRLFIPKVTGKRPEDLKIYELDNYATIDTFPRSKWGIPEPPKSFIEGVTDATYLGLVDCIIMPGVAFDSACSRIGHGKGYYDCFVERLSAANIAAGKAPPITIAIAFDEQILDDGAIPMDAHDRVLDYVVTPTHTYKRREILQKEEAV